MGVAGLLLAILATSTRAPHPASVRVDHLAAAGGAELLTLYRTVPNHAEIPVLAVLRDTMGDSNLANNRLRYVWILTGRRAPWYRHALAALPFFYTRMPARPPSPYEKPSPVLDLGKPADRSVASLARSLLQTQAFDPMGAVVRTSTRSYQMNEEHRRSGPRSSRDGGCHEPVTRGTGPNALVWQERCRALPAGNWPDRISGRLFVGVQGTVARCRRRNPEPFAWCASPETPRQRTWIDRFNSSLAATQSR